jgi:hypothetical protein
MQNKTEQKPAMKVWKAMCLPCIYEGNWFTLSLHYSKKGAMQAIREDKAKAKKEGEDLEDMRWAYRKAEVLP